MNPCSTLPGGQEIPVNKSRDTAQLIQFLEQELALSTSSIAMAVRYSEQDLGPLPMVLWQYGLVSLDQLNKIYDWLEQIS